MLTLRYRRRGAGAKRLSAALTKIVPQRLRPFTKVPLPVVLPGNFVRSA